MFVVREVINSSGGKTGCFLYRGTLAAGPPPRCATPEACCPLVRSPSAGGLLSGVQEVPQCGGRGLEEEEEQTDLQAYEGQELTLYMR